MMNKNFVFDLIKVALAVIWFALKSLKEYLLLFTYLITLGKDVTCKILNKQVSELFICKLNTELKECGLIDS